MELILASTSPYRRALLERLGLPFHCRPPGLDEGALKAQYSDLEPAELAERLAIAKASSLGAQDKNVVILGSDQIAAIDGRILGKPGSVEAAVEQLTALSGRTHELVTALALCRGDGTVERTHIDIARLRMRRLNGEELARYVEADRPLDCAGSYKLEARGILLFESIEAADHSAITGLPLIVLTSFLRDLGFRLP